MYALVMPMTSATCPGWMPAPWVALPREVMEEVTEGKGALIDIKQGALCALEDDVLAKFEGVVQHQTGVRDA